MTDPRLALLLRSIDRSFRGPAWHGPSMMSALRGVRLEQVSFRPQPERHNAWELVVHAAYWKYRVCAAIADLPRGSFDLKGSNFFERPGGGDEAAWRADVELLKSWHERLIEAVGGFDPERLGDPLGDGRFTYEALLDGAGAHDIYHAGQIRLLLKMWDERMWEEKSA